MKVTELFKIKKQLISNADESSARLATWAKDKRGVMGLLDDDAKKSETYKVLSAQYAYDKDMLRKFNGLHYHNKELIQMTKDDITQRRLAKLAK